jgi:hypothetical protein
MAFFVAVLRTPIAAGEEKRDGSFHFRIGAASVRRAAATLPEARIGSAGKRMGMT